MTNEEDEIIKETLKTCELLGIFSDVDIIIPLSLKVA